MANEEIWKDIEGYRGYQASNKGRIRSFWKRKHRPTGYGCDWIIGDEPRISKTSDDGNGYLKLMLYDRDSGRRRCRKVHRVIAETFIPNDDPVNKTTVDHIKPGPESKRDNSVSNLRWIPRPDNVKKAYKDGMHDERIRKSWKDIVVTDEWTGNEIYFDSINEASIELGIKHSTISHALHGKNNIVGGRYRFEFAGREERLLYGDEDYKLLSWLRADLR